MTAMKKAYHAKVEEKYRAADDVAAEISQLATRMRCRLDDATPRPVTHDDSVVTKADRVNGSIPKRITVLYVDDERPNRLAIGLELGDQFHVLTAASADDALVTLSMQRVDVVFCDNRMPGMSGADLARIVSARWPNMPIYLVTAFDDNIKGPWLDVLKKPFDMEKIRRLIRVSAHA